MTTSVPDWPDWVPPQSPVAVDKVLYQSPSGGENLPITVSGLDVSAWTSLAVMLQGVNINTLTPASVTMYFGTATFASWADFTTCDLSGNDGPGDSGLIRNMPIAGPQFGLQMSGSLIGVKGSLTLMGSTRQSVPEIRPLTVMQESPSSLSGSITVPANSTTTVGVVGPYSNGVHAAMTGPTDTRMNLYTYALESSSLTARGVGGPIGNGNGYTYADIDCPGALLLCTITNANTTTARSVNYSLSGLR